MDGITIYEPGETDRNASVRDYSVPPAYPTSLRRERVVGKAVVTLVVNGDGSVNRIEQIDKVNQPEFRQLFLGWVKDWKFEPASKDGRPVAQRIRIPIEMKPPER